MNLAYWITQLLRTMIAIDNWFMPEMTQLWGVNKLDGKRRSFAVASLHP
jgi:hypothetical protein